MPIETDDIKAVVLIAIQVAARQAFFNTNEFISKRLVPGQYHLYAELGSVTRDEIRQHIDDRISTTSVNKKLKELVQEGKLLTKSSGRIKVYWLSNTEFLQDS